MSAAPKKLPKNGGILPKEKVQTLVNAFLAAAVLGIALAGAGFAMDQKRFAFSYLTGFLFTWTICAGGLFFVLVQHLTRAGWSVGPRRWAEWLSQGLIVCAALFLPLLAVGKTLFPWLRPEAHDDHILHQKAAYLNQGFFLARLAIYFVIWIGLALFFSRSSRAQDTSGDRKLSERMQGYSAPATFAFAVTFTFAAFDWVMSLDPYWFSTIFGVYTFAGALTSSTAIMALTAKKVKDEGWAGDLITVEHQHDLGKFLFGFTVFWAYIGFSQFMLIWYANIPEETVWFRHRWEHGWDTVSLALVFGHFILPFAILLSRTAKRGPGIVAGAALLLVMHWVDLYWLVMPNADAHFHFSWIDLGGLLAPLGVTGYFISRKVASEPIVPLKDPYVAEAVKVENLV